MRNRIYLLIGTMIGLALTASQSLAQSNYEPYTFTTLAGKAGSAGIVDGIGSAARFKAPSGVAVDNAGNVYVAETYDHTIRKVTPAGVVTTLAGLSQDTNADGFPDGGYADGTGSAARFNFPFSLAVDSAGNVYVADTGNQAIRKITPVGVVTTLAGDATITNIFGPAPGGYADGTGKAARFFDPRGIAVDSGGNLYVADSWNGIIRKVTPVGVVTALAGLAGFNNFGNTDGTGGAARFNLPYGVAVDGSGNVYVADSGNNTIRKLTAAGVVATLAGLSQDTNANGFPDGDYADGTGSAARFGFPASVAVDTAGNLYVADYNNNTIRKVTATGVVTTLAGLAGNDGSADGTGSVARFYGPQGVAVDSVGNVYVADLQNHTIRKGVPASTVPVSLSITTQPQSQTVVAGGNVTFSVSVGGAGPFGYQWQKNGLVIPNAFESSLTLTNAQATDVAVYTVIVSNLDRSVVSARATLYVNPPAANVPPTVSLTSPADGAIFNQGTDLVISATASDSDGSVARIAFFFGTNFIGEATSAPYSVVWTNLGLGSFTLAARATDNLGATTYSLHVQITVQAPPDTSGNGSEYTFTTLAGNSGYGNADGMGNAARFLKPRGVAVDSAGTLYVADTSNHTIRKVTPSGVVTTLAGLSGKPGSADGAGSAARFSAPFGLAADSAGNVYVADSANNTIRKITPGGMVSTLAGTAGPAGTADGTGSAAQFGYPNGVAVDSVGNVYVADTGNHMIRKVTPTGVVTTLAGLAEKGNVDGAWTAARFNFPAGLAVDNLGNIFIADTGNNTIRKMTPGGEVTTLAGGFSSWVSVDGTGSAAQFASPYAVSVDSAGNVYVADFLNHAIRKVTSAGVVTTLAGLAHQDGSGELAGGSADGIGSAALFSFPSGVAVDSAGNIYVADTFNNAIRKVTPAGTVSTPIGLLGGPGSTDGLGSAARFSNPLGVAVDSAGIIYVADMANHTIRKITPSGEVTTLAGLAGNHGSVDGTGSDARFYSPYGLAVDSSGNVYVGDYFNHTIRKITPAGAVTTLAGLSQDTNGDGLPDSGNANGTGSAARFSYPGGLAVDSAGNVYVAEWYDNTIRKLTPSGQVTLLAGSAGASFGNVDGIGSAARFSNPLGLTVDNIGNVYVADTHNNKIRKVTPAAVVTTLAGWFYPGSADGTGSSALFHGAAGVAADSSGNIYVADTGNNTIRKVTPAGVVTTLAGLPQIDQFGSGAPFGGSVDGPGSGARFNQPYGVAVDRAGNIYVADTYNHTIRKGIPPVNISAPPLIMADPQSQYRWVGEDVLFTVGYHGSGPFSYQWRKNGAPIAGATASSLLLTTVHTSDAADYSVTVSNPAGSATSATASLTVRVSDVNAPPTVSLTSPINDATFYPGTNLEISAAALDRDGSVVSVTFFNEWRLIGQATNAPFSMIWSNLGVGRFVLTALATDNLGAIAVSTAVLVTVASPWVAPSGTTGSSSNYTFTTLAGLPGDRAYADGVGSAARFASPQGVAVDSAGNIYVADEGSSTIRKVTQEGVVTTLAGSAFGYGSVDGTGSAARFKTPQSVAVDSTDNLYVGDAIDHTIRKITPAGMVTTLAGLSGSAGSADGTGSVARFNGPTGVAVDFAGNVYVADTYNHTVRKMTPAGETTTLAGLAGSEGAADGAGSVARFSSVLGVAVDSAGFVYVADSFNSTVRKISLTGVVSTLAGLALNYGSKDAMASSARFLSPAAVAVDKSGNIYVADQFNHTIRRITPAGVVTTLGGSSEIPAGAMFPAGGYQDGTGTAAHFNQPRGVAVDSAGNVYVADTENNVIRKGVPPVVISVPPTITTQPQSKTVVVDTRVTFTVVAGGSAPLNYQWRKNGADLFGATDSTFVISTVATSDAGEYTVVVGNPQGSVSSASATLTVTDAVNTGPTYYFTTIAGRPLTGGSADGSRYDARFIFPAGMAVDAAGNLYVADRGNHTIRKVTPAGVVTTLAGLAGQRGSVDGAGSDARFWFPSGVAVDGAGNVYVADSSNHAIRKVSTAGEVTTFAGLVGVRGYADGIGGDARFFDPEGIAVDGSGFVYVGDSINNRIRKITPAGVVTTLAGAGRGSADGTGAEARFNSPRGLAVDSTGNIYVADQHNHTIRKVSPEGVVTTLAGQAGSPGDSNGIGSDGRFSFPASVAVDPDGNVYVADSNNHVLRKITPLGVVTTFAGKMPSFTFADGEASQARFFLPMSIVLDRSGSFYVADYGDQTIRKGTLEKPAAFLALIASTVYRDAGGTVVNFYVAGVAGLSVVVEASADLVNWLPLDTNTLSGLFDFTDSQNGGASNRFYRARVP